MKAVPMYSIGKVNSHTCKSMVGAAIGWPERTSDAVMTCPTDRG